VGAPKAVSGGEALRVVEPGTALGLERGAAAVCIPVYGAFGHFAQAIRSVLAHTPGDVTILVADDASPDPGIRAHLERLAQEGVTGERLVYMRQPENRGFVRNVNDSFDLLAPADVVILNSDCVVAADWLAKLRAAAYSDTRVATATPLTNNGTIVSVPFRNNPIPNLPQNWSLDEAEQAVGNTSPVLRPRIPTAIGHCTYVRRSAIELVGKFDEAFSPGYGEEVDFSQRCVAHGLSHVVADDVLVLHYGSASFSEDGARPPQQDLHHKIIQARYPYYDEWVEDTARDVMGPLWRSVSSAARALAGLSVTVDGRILTQFITGSQLHTLEVIAALDALGGVRVRVVVPHDIGDYAKQLMAGMANVDLISADQVVPGIDQTDVVHRPYQVSSDADIELLRHLAPRLVITHQDLISYHNPSYFRSWQWWNDHRRLTRTALAAADQVVFFSRHAAFDAMGEDLVSPDKVNVVPIGTDHRLAALKPEPVPPRGAEQLRERPFLLCLGTDFRHKNRVFALRLLETLRDDHGWDGMLVFAGPHAAAGTSAGDEAAYLTQRPGLAEAVTDLAAVEESGKVWLLQNAVAMVYPTTFEGFGLVPFEAADEGLPCLFASQTSLAELLPRSAAKLVPWDPVASAAAVAPLLHDGPARADLVRTIRAAGAPLTWSRTAHGLLDVYRRASTEPAREAARLARDQLEVERELVRLREAGREWQRYQRFFGPVSQYDHLDGALVRPDGIPADLRRPLLAIARRRWLSAIFFGPIRLAHRAGYLARHRRLPSAPPPPPQLNR
jgi:GT2 family glycosyltransferase/glycosyltransferase involved in cell wall biosynthesis